MPGWRMAPAIAAVLAGCAAAPDRSPPPAELALPAQPSGVEIGRGRASWYGERFHGRRTASGERFDMNAMTAAHPTLPFGTLVRVRNVDNGREVVVRINDRGPHTGNRIIDLSRAAAAAIDLVRAGVGAVVLVKP